MSVRDFEKNCQEAIQRLFETVKNQRGETELHAALRHTVEIGDVSAGPLKVTKLNYYLLPDTLHNITNLYCYIRYLENSTPSPPVHVLVMLKVQSYLQCMETRYVYKVIGNLDRLLRGEHCNGELYDKFVSGSQCYSDLKRLSAEGGSVITAVLDAWHSFADYDLRNAIAHNDYLIDASTGYVIIPYNVLGNAIKGHPKAGRKGTYSFAEIESKFVRANEFQSAFKTVIQQYGVAIGPRY